MELWSWQKTEQSLITGRVDLSRSEYYNSVENAKAAYAELARRLGTDQIIWCYIRADEYIRSARDTRVPWVLNVPDDSILRFTDDRVWNKILGRDVRRPDFLYIEWLNSIPAGEGFDYVLRKEKEYHARPAPNGDWWSVLFIDHANLRVDDKEQMASALLRHPIPESWVVRIG